MTKIKNVFISHAHEDDKLIASLKNLVSREGVNFSDSSINKNNPNDAKSEEYIKSAILAPAIRRASAVIIPITRNTVRSGWVKWEVSYASSKGKIIVGVPIPGETNVVLPKSLENLADAVVEWQAKKIIDAIEGKTRNWDDPETGKPRPPKYKIERYSC